MNTPRIAALVTACSATLALATACGDDSPAGDSLKGSRLVYVNYGGDTITAAKKAWLDPFAREKGVQVSTDSPSDPAKVKAMVDAGNTTWDVIALDTGSGAVGCGTLYEKRTDDIDVSKIDPKYLSDDCGVPIQVQTIALVYNKKVFGDNPPTKISDFTDTARFPGKRIMLNYAVGGLESVLLGDGVPGDQLYPLDLDRASQAVDKLGTSLSLDASLAQEQALLESGDFAMCMCYTGRAALSAEKGADLGVVWDGAFNAWEALYAVKGSKSPQAQQELLDYIAQPENQARYSENVPYGPTTPDAEPNVPADWVPWMPANNEDKMGTPAFYDPTWWTDNTDQGFTAWTEMTAG